MGRNLLGAAAAVVLAAGVGCTETRTYGIAVRNDLDRPVTVCLTKTFGPFEPGWESPEEVAGPNYPASEDRPPGTVVEPGKTAREGPIHGRFYPDRGYADLRVYVGKLTLTQMNAVSRGSLDRLDAAVHPGLNQLVVQYGPGGRVQAVPPAEARVNPVPSLPGVPAGPVDPVEKE